MFPGQFIDGNRAVITPGSDVLAGLLNVFVFGIESMNKVAVVCLERIGQLAVATVQVDDEAALYAGSFENDSGLIKRTDLSRPAGLRAALGEERIADAEDGA